MGCWDRYVWLNNPSSRPLAGNVVFLGFVFEPTVIAAVPNDAPVVQEAVFGAHPLICFLRNTGANTTLIASLSFFSSLMAII